MAAVGTLIVPDDPERTEWVPGRRKFFFGLGALIVAAALPTVEMAKALEQAKVNPAVVQPGEILVRRSLVVMTHQEGGRRWETNWKRVDVEGGGSLYVPEES